MGLSFFRKDGKMDKTKLNKIEELDARIEKINYDLAGLETRKREMEENKFAKQQEIEKLQVEKNSILSKTDKMNRLQKIIYIAFVSKNDLKQIDLINAKVTEYRNEKDNIQNKIDIQNKLYADTIKEKESYIEQRKKLYIDNTNVLKNQQEASQEVNGKTSHIQDLVKIHEITKKYKESRIMEDLRQMIEKTVDKLLNVTEDKNQTKSQEKLEEQEEMD